MDVGFSGLESPLSHSCQKDFFILLSPPWACPLTPCVFMLGLVSPAALALSRAWSSTAALRHFLSCFHPRVFLLSAGACRVPPTRSIPRVLCSGCPEKRALAGSLGPGQQAILKTLRARVVVLGANRTGCPECQAQP